MEHLQTTLNKEQCAAVEAIEGPVLVFAGAGTGKTRTLTARIVHMVKDCHISQEHILAITFTKKATNEMRERINRALAAEGGFVNISTIHSLCARILRRNSQLLGYERDFEIIDDEEMMKILSDIYKDENLDRKLLSPRAAMKAISDYKNGMGSLSGMIAELYQTYQAYLKENNMVDFDDLLILTNRLLTENPDVLHYYQYCYQYILVDEFQDTNTIQYNIIKQLGEQHHNIFVVGDDDQSIYSFRGACADNMFTFRKDFPETKTFQLVQNYRSSTAVLKGANAVIRNNVMREKKELISHIPGKLTDVTVQEAYYYEDEARFVINEIVHMVQHETYHYHDIAILYRNNALSRNFELALIEERIPYNIYGGFSYLKRKEIKDIISYLRFIIDDTKRTHFKRIINQPARGIGDKTLAKLFECMDETGVSLFDAIDEVHRTVDSTKTAALVEFKKIIIALQEQLEKVDLVTFYDLLLEKTGYLQMLKAEDDEEINRVANVKEFKSILYRLEQSFGDDHISNQQKIQIGLDEIILDQSFGDDQAVEGVVLSTIHSVKGLEFKAVFVVGLEEGIFPAVREDVDMEEERRVAYVAFTRAKEKIFLTCASRRLIYGRIVRNAKSRFLIEYLGAEDIKESVDERIQAKKVEGEIAIGSKVSHTFFGYGIVIAADDKFIQILFEKDQSIRKIAKNHPTITKA